MSTSQFIVVLITAPSKDVGSRMATLLVEERLAACVNIVPGVHSVYRWEGKVQNEEEVLLLVKSARDGFDALTRRVQEIHPYDVPEIVAIAPQAMSSSYRRFLEDNT